MSSPQQQILWHNRMEARVIAGILLLVGLSLTGVLVAATQVATRSAVTRASVNLQDARQAFYRVVDSRAENVASQTRLILTLPIFRATIASGDIPTLLAMADGYREQLRAQFALLANPSGKIIAASGWPQEWDTPSALLGTVAAARASHRDIVPIGGQLFLVVSEPANFAEELIGTITFGFPLDDGVAQELAQVTHAEVNLISRGKLAGSSLQIGEQQGLRAALAGSNPPTAKGIAANLQSIGTRKFIAGSFPIFRERETGHLRSNFWTSFSDRCFSPASRDLRWLSVVVSCSAAAPPSR
jgi:hypothetical protein